MLAAASVRGLFVSVINKEISNVRLLSLGDGEGRGGGRRGDSGVSVLLF